MMIVPCVSVYRAKLITWSSDKTNKEWIIRLTPQRGRVIATMTRTFYVLADWTTHTFFFVVDVEHPEQHALLHQQHRTTNDAAGIILSSSQNVHLVGSGMAGG